MFSTLYSIVPTKLRSDNWCKKTCLYLRKTSNGIRIITVRLFYCGALAISNLADLTQYDEREEQYKQIMKNYSEKERKTMAEIFGKIFGLLSSVVYDDGVFSDYLGEIFMNCNMGNKNTGQFFTPYHVSKMCAKIAIGTPNKADGKILTLCEPCCGSGGMVLAAMDVLKNDFGINYAM